MTDLLWHYTIGDRWFLIQEARYLKLATAMIGKGERGAVWFSRNQDYEPTAFKGPGWQHNGVVTMGMRLELRRLGHGLWRIGVDPATAPVSWEQFKETSGIDPIIAYGLTGAGRKQGADPADWYCSYAEVPEERWRRVDFWFNGGWMPDPSWAPLPPVTFAGIDDTFGLGKGAT
ncbi:MAG TPA: hypothetical protein VGP44_05125 [Gemmatimonadales bacterium]|nr:hypothetical protein [Gemmatimonadales bacterium]